MALNYCPSCGAKLPGAEPDQAEQMPADYAPDLPDENQDPPADETIARARAVVDNLGDESMGPLVGKTVSLRSMLQELEDAMAKGESLDLPYYRQTLFELSRELDRIQPMMMVARMRGG